MLKIERLDALLKEKKMSRRQLEREAGLGTGTISRWRTNSPSMANLQKVADVLGVSIGYLNGEEDATASFPAVRIPVLGEVPCGIPTAAVEYVEESLPTLMTNLKRESIIKCTKKSTTHVVSGAVNPCLVRMVSCSFGQRGYNVSLMPYKSF